MYMYLYTYKYTHTDTDVALGTAATHQHRKSPGLRIQQELTEQVGCLWFHDISFTEAEKFYENNLDKVSCDFFSSSGLEFPQPQTVLLLLSFLIPTEDGEIFRGPTPEQSYPGQKLYLDS